MKDRIAAILAFVSLNKFKKAPSEVEQKKYPFLKRHFEALITLTVEVNFL